jgi:hypothetical protein
MQDNVTVKTFDDLEIHRPELARGHCRADGIGIAAANWEGEEQYRPRYRQKNLLGVNGTADREVLFI